MKTKSDNESLIEEFMYPRDGYVRIPQRMAEDIVAKTGPDSVLLGSTVTRIKYIGPNDFEIVYRKPDGEEYSIKATTVVSTIPLGLLPRIMEPACDQKVIDAAKGLSFRALITVNLILSKERVSIDTWLYVQDEDILFGRLHEPKNWSPAMIPDQSTTSLVLECFCTKDDHIWNMTDEEVGQRCIDDLEKKLKFIESSEVIDFSCVRTLQAYPVYDLEYAEKLVSLMISSDNLKVCISLGEAGRIATITRTIQLRWACCWVEKFLVMMSTIWMSTLSLSIRRSSGQTIPSAISIS